MSITKNNLIVIGAISFLLLFGSAIAECVLPQTNTIYTGNQSGAFAFRSGIIVDSEKTKAYLMNPPGGIDAIRLTSGKVIWSTDQASKPLALRGKHLIAQGQQAAAPNHLPIVVLDVENNGEVLKKFTAKLPENVVVSIVDGLGSAFRTRAHDDGDSIIIEWDYSWQEIGGMERTPGSPKENVHVRGAIQIDLHSGEIETLAPDTALPSAISTLLPDGLAQIFIPENSSKPLWSVGEVWATTAYEKINGRQQLLLRRWENPTGRPKPDLALFEAGLTYRYPSADCRYLLASRIGTESEAMWQWELFSIESGELVASTRLGMAAAWFFITETILIYEARPTGRIVDGRAVIDQSLRLRAIDLQTDEPLWEHPYLDIAYRGPYPAAGNEPAVP